MKPVLKKEYSLRPKKPRRVHLQYEDEQDGHRREEDIGVSDAQDDIIQHIARRKPKRKVVEEDDCACNNKGEFLYPHLIFDQDLQMDKLPKRIDQLEKLLRTIDEKIVYYERVYKEQDKDTYNRTSFVDRDSVPVCTDIRTFNFEYLRTKQLEFGHRLFDVIMMDPPWKLSSSNPSRGVAIQYESLPDDTISRIPINRLQTEGLLCVWTINAKYRLTCRLLREWGYTLINQITWVKKTVNGKIAKGHGFYLQHAKESCLIGFKGDFDSKRYNFSNESNLIFSERRGQSQKPNEIYETLERIVPNGFYLQIFGRRNNLKNKWVTIGNQI